jgi:hypothetical protein
MSAGVGHGAAVARANSSWTATSSSAFVGHGGAGGGQAIRSYVILVLAAHLSVAIGAVGAMGA